MNQECCCLCHHADTMSDFWGGILCTSFILEDRCGASFLLESQHFVTVWQHWDATVGWRDSFMTQGVDYKDGRGKKKKKKTNKEQSYISKKKWRRQRTLKLGAKKKKKLISIAKAELHDTVLQPSGACELTQRWASRYSTSDYCLWSASSAVSREWLALAVSANCI